MRIEEVLGYNSSASSDADSVTKKYYVRCDVKNGVVLETPEQAKAAFESYAATLPVSDGLELGDVALEEEKNANGLYFGTITFKSPDPKTKRKIADDLFESYGEKMSEGRKSGSHERFFRIKSDSAQILNGFKLDAIHSFHNGNVRPFAYQ